MTETLPVQNRIVTIRNCRVMIDSDLASLYEVETRALVQGVKRNLVRFPIDFMFQLTDHEFTNLRSQFVISKPEGRGGRRTTPFAFTEQGVAMLSTVLNSPRALQVNIEIMREFVRLRQVQGSSSDLAKKVDALEKKYDGQFQVVFDAIKALIAKPSPSERQIGFGIEKK